MVTSPTPNPPAGAMPGALSLQGVCKRFGDQVAVDHLTLRIGCGEIVALLGPNGAGKSTTIGIALGFVRPDSGAVQISGVDALANPQLARQRLAYIPEQVNLYPVLSGLENLEYFASLSGLALAHVQLRAALTAGGLPAEAHARRVSTYSKGMRQKVGIAIALARSSELLLMDEPTSGLDPVASNDINHMLRLTAARGIGVLMATHDIFRAHEVASRTVLMRAGKVVADLPSGSTTFRELEDAYLSLMKESAT